MNGLAAWGQVERGGRLRCAQTWKGNGSGRIETWDREGAGVHERPFLYTTRSAGNIRALETGERRRKHLREMPIVFTLYERISG